MSENDSTYHHDQKHESEYLGDQPVDIQLDGKNYCKGYLPTGHGLVCLFDSGATQSLISIQTVQDSPYLSKLQKIDIKPVRFRIGNGEFLYAKQAIKPKVNFQGNPFQLFTLIAENFTGPDILLGTSTLKELKGSLDFNTNTFRARPKKACFTPTTSTVISPGHVRIIHVKGRLPKHMKNAALLLRPTPSVANFCPSHMLSKFRHGIAPMRIYNHSTKPLHLKHEKPIAYTDLDDFIHVTQPLPPDYKPQPPESGSQPVSDIQAENLRKYPHLTVNDPDSRLTVSEILHRDIKLDKSILSSEQKQEFYKILENNYPAFSVYGEVGTCPNFEVDIHLTDTTPFYIRPYPATDQNKAIIDKELTKLVKLGILQQGHTPYTSPVLLVKKRDSQEKRCVADLRVLNDRCVAANSDVVTVHDIMQKLGKSKCKVFSVVDLKSAFHCLSLSPKAQAYTGISSYRGGPCYFHKKLPMGCKVSMSLFSQKINDVLSKIPNSASFCQAVHDDILIFSENTAAHFAHISLILDALMKNGLKISPKKCRFFQSRVIYLGHVLSVSSEGIVQITALNDRCNAIRKIKAPTNARGVRRFIGAVMYLSSFLPKLQTLLAPLHELTRKNKPFVWQARHEEAFQNIKQLLVQPPVLSAPTGKGQLRLYSDTSRVATGSYLAEYVDGKEHIIAYYSKRLPPAAKNYSVSELELMGIYLNVTAFRYMLLGRDFQIFCDHSALVQIFRSKRQPPTTRIQKLLERLSEYSFQLAYIKGSDIVLSDFLSRAPLDDDKEFDRILPVAFSANAVYELESLAETVTQDAFYNLPAPEKIVTRSYAKRMNIPVKPLYKPTPKPRTSSLQSKTKSSTTSATTTNKTQPVLPPTPVSTSVPQVVTQPPGIPLPPVHVQCAPPVIPLQRLESTPVRKSDSVEPRLVDLANKPDVIDEFSNDISDLLKKPQPLISQIDQMNIKHVPDQATLNKVLKIIKRKVIRDYNLPIDAQQFAIAQQTSPHFKPVYDYLAHEILPSDKKSARVVLIKSEQFFLCNGIMFRIFFPNNSDDFCLQLAVPEKYIDTIIGLHHGSGLLGHAGCTRTFLTIRRNFYIPGLFQRIVAYIQSCNRCQEVKGKRDMVRTFHERIPANFEPFETISLDFKSMPVSPASYKYLMIVTCSMTRFVVAVPLKTLDAPTVCEALIQKVITLFGVPSMIVTDAAASLTGHLIELLCSTLGIQQKLISVGNHGSLLAERQIRSIADLIKANLSIYGTSWTQFVSTAVYTYNSFSSPHLGGYSPFYLLFLREPADLTSLQFKPRYGLSRSHADYVEHLKQKFQNVSKCMLQLQEHHQLAQNSKLANKLQKCPIYAEGQLVYLHKPNTTGMTANSRKFKTLWVGPFVINQVLDRTHYILADLKGNIIPDIFNFARLKPAYLRATHEKNVENIDQLQALLKKAITSEPHTAHYLTDDVVSVGPTASPDSCYLQDTSVQNQCHWLDQYMAYQHSNDGLLAPSQLTQKQKDKQLDLLMKSPAENDLTEIEKARFHKGKLQLLLSVPFGASRYRYWWSPIFDPLCAKIVHFVLDAKDIKCTGSVTKYTVNLARKQRTCQ